MNKMEIMKMDRARKKAMVIHEDEDEFDHDPHHQSIQLKPWLPFRMMLEWRVGTRMTLVVELRMYCCDGCLCSILFHERFHEALFYLVSPSVLRFKMILCCTKKNRMQ